MRATLASVSLLFLFGILSAAMPADKITYLECRADNEDTSSFSPSTTPRRRCATERCSPPGSRPRPSTPNSSAGRTGSSTQIGLPQGQGKALRAQRAHPCAHRTGITSRRHRASFASPDSGLGDLLRALPALAFTHSTTSALSTAGRAARLSDGTSRGFIWGRRRWLRKRATSTRSLRPCAQCCATPS